MKNRFWMVPLVWVLAQFAVAAGGQSVDQSRNAEAGGMVRINVARGDVVVEGWQETRVSVTGTLDQQAEKFIFETERGETFVEVKLPRGLNSWCCEDGSRLRIQVPRGSRVYVSGVSTDVKVSAIDGSLEVQGVSGDVDIAEIRDRVDVTTVSGDIDARTIASRVELKSVSGDIRARGVEGDVSLSSVSGDVTGARITGDLDIETVSGDIEVEDASLAIARASTVSGDADLESELRGGGRFEFESVSGSIRLRLVGKVSARFDLKTASGNIRNRISGDKPTSSKYARDETLRFVYGGGNGEVVAESRSGDIVVSQD